MTRNTLKILIITIASFAIISSCGGKSDKRKIADTMRVYVEQSLPDGQSFNFIGLSNRRDTIFMGVSHPCVGVIYTISDSNSGKSSRHFADVILSDDYSTALSVKELDFDPIDFVEQKIKHALKEKIRGNTEK